MKDTNPGVRLLIFILGGALTVGLFLSCKHQEQAQARNKASEATGIVIRRDCGRYKKVYIDCEPADPRWLDKKYLMTPEQIIAGCKKYISETRMPDYGFSYRCHQMSGGGLSIDGAGHVSPVWLEQFKVQAE